MEKLADWAVTNPSAAASLASAVVAASVALIVFAVTQMIARKRDATQLLLPKLERTYLLINELAEHNVRMFRLYHLAMDGNAEAQTNLNSLDDIIHYGHDRAKTIIMHIRLYFPKLSRIHQHLFAAERKMNDLRYRTRSPDPPEAEDLLMASGEVGHMIRLMEQEIVDNRDVLLKANWIPRRYRGATHDQINSPRPRPEGPYMQPR